MPNFLSASEPIDKLATYLSAWMHTYSIMRLSHCFLKPPGQRWFMRSARIQLAWTPDPNDKREIEVRTQSIAAKRVSTDLQGLDAKSFLHMLQNAPLGFFFDERLSDLAPINARYDWLEPRFANDTTQIVPFMVNLDDGYGANARQMPREVADAELMSAAEPFSSLSELANELGLKGPLEQRSPTSNIVVALELPVHLTELDTLENGRCIEFRCNSTAIAEQVLTRLRIDKEMVPVHPLEWRSESAMERRALVKIPIRSGEAKAFVNYAGILSGRLAISLESRNAISRCLDGLGVQDPFELKPREIESKAFEYAVSALLSSFGLVTVWADNSQNSKGVKPADGVPDLIVNLPGTESVLVIECTTSVPSHKDTLHTLKMRVNKVKEAFEKANLSADLVTALIATTFSDQDCAKAFVEAKKFGIKILSFDALQRLHAMRDRRVAREEIWKKLTESDSSQPTNWPFS